jgi:hypothetical protein
MNVVKIIGEYLKQHGYDGLFNVDDECCCELNDMVPCGNCFAGCKLGYKRAPRADLGEDMDAEWVIGEQKQ